MSLKRRYNSIIEKFLETEKNTNKGRKHNNLHEHNKEKDNNININETRKIL